jgi:Zn-dependent protease with chaperone function
MDFFTQQEKARKKTGLLVFYFMCAVLIIILAIYAVIDIVLLSNHTIHDPLQPLIMLAVAAGTILVVGGGSFFKINQLRQGGSAVAEMLGAVLVSPDTKDLKEKQLLNVVEEMAIASGTGMPEVYVLEEDGINAFAAGWKSTDAAVCITRGCLKALSRDELQGVVAHEFSHLLNGDMRLNIRLMGFIFGILVIGQLGYWVLRGSSGSGRSRSKDKGGGAAILVIALALFAIGYIGVFFGNLIKAAVSRTREYLADSSAVQFTRNPLGISGALRKIGALSEGSRIGHHNAGQASHMYFANGLSGFWSNIFATHPSLEKRIKSIDPSFNGDFSSVNILAPRAAASQPVSSAPPRSQSGAPGFSTEPLSFNAGMMLTSVGSVTAQHVAYSSKLIRSIPDRVSTAILDKNGAQAVLFGLLLSQDAGIRDKQIAAIDASSPPIGRRIAELAPCFKEVERQAYTILSSLSVNSLRTLNEAEFSFFIATLKSLIEADGIVDLFEFMVLRMVRTRLEARFSKNNTPGRTITNIDTVLALDCAGVFSALSWESAGAFPVAAESNFKCAAALFPNTRLEFLPREQCTMALLDASLDRMNRLSPPLKKQVLAACVAIAETDGVITLSEAEFLRAVSDSLSCPMPPLIIPRS